MTVRLCKLCKKDLGMETEPVHNSCFADEWLKEKSL